MNSTVVLKILFEDLTKKNFDEWFIKDKGKDIQVFFSDDIIDFFPNNTYLLKEN